MDDELMGAAQLLLSALGLSGPVIASCLRPARTA